MEFLVIDDHPLIRASIKSLIQHYFPQADCIESFSMEQALPLLNNHHPDLILLDLALSGMSGIEALTTLRTLHSASPVMILSSTDNPLDMQRCLNAGAAGYLVKTEPSQAMLAAINTVLLGGKHTPQALKSQSSDITKQLKLAEQITPRQIDVLQLMQTGQRNKEIANALHISEATIKVHCRDIFRFLGVNTRHQAVQEALRLGLLNRPH